MGNDATCKEEHFEVTSYPKRFYLHCPSFNWLKEQTAFNSQQLWHSNFIFIIITIIGLLIIIIISRFAEPTWESLLVIANPATAGNLTEECAKVGFLKEKKNCDFVRFFCFFHSWNFKLFPFVGVPSKFIPQRRCGYWSRWKLTFSKTTGSDNNSNNNIIIETVRLLMSMKIDRIQDNRIRWGDSYWDQNSEPYQVLEGEVDYAVSS